MTHKSLQSFVGIFIILSHAFIIFYIFYLTKKLLFVNQAIDLLSIIAPLFTAYLVSITKEFATTTPKIKTVQTVSNNNIFINFFYPIVFVLSLFLCIYWYQMEIIESFDNLKKVIGAIEMSFGIYFGIIMDSLFSKKLK